MSDKEKTREEELEETLKEALFYMTVQEKEMEEQNLEYDPTGWMYNVRNSLRHSLGSDHYGFAGWGFESVLYVWLVMELWEDGRIVPRAICLTENRAEKAKDLVDYSYESKEPSERPKRVFVEHQRTEHVFGISMEGRKYQGLYEK